ncbi:MAG: RDD family protein [Bacteroidetes bacterium]|nr:RDD family protein [Bacteroidota bacterium]
METIDSTESTAPVEYAGFWLRFVAYIIDGIILYTVHMIVLVPVFTLMGITAFTNHESFRDLSDAEATGMVMGIIGALGALILVFAILGWLYFALLESSSKQATVGKMALGLKVTNMNGERISFLQATGRFFGKIVSGMILYIGFMMAGFTEKKQALHDIMANCLVVKKSR